MKPSFSLAFGEEYLEVFILKVVKVLCFDRLLYVFILKELWGLRFGAFLAGKKGRISCD
jgi:hypothetical protein